MRASRRWLQAAAGGRADRWGGVVLHQPGDRKVVCPRGEGGRKSGGGARCSEAQQRDRRPAFPPAQAWHRREQGSSQAEDAGHQLPPRGPPRCGVSQRLAHAHSRSLTLAGTGLPLKGQARGQCGGVLAAARAALAHVPAGAPCTGPQRPPPLSRGGTEVLFRQGLSPSTQGTLPGLSSRQPR